MDVDVEKDAGVDAKADYARYYLVPDRDTPHVFTYRHSPSPSPSSIPESNHPPYFYVRRRPVLSRILLLVVFAAAGAVIVWFFLLDVGSGFRNDEMNAHASDVLDSKFQLSSENSQSGPHASPSSVLVPIEGQEEDLVDGDREKWSLDPTVFATFNTRDLPQQHLHGGGSSQFPILRPTRFLPDECLESWFAYGALCDRSLLGPEDKIDLVYLWVNGSDPLWQQQREMRTASTSGGRMTSLSNHFREQIDLIYTLRSALASLGGETKALRTIHVVSADMPEPNMRKSLSLADAGIEDTTEGEYAEGEDEKEAEDDTYRIGQIPRWLDWDILQEPSKSSKSVALRWHFHSEIFHTARSSLPLSQDRTSHPWSSEEDWKRLALPSFNSFAIESRLAWLNGMSEICVQANDDMFFLRPMATSDFYSRLFGSVFRLDNQVGLQAFPVPSRVADSGEWGGLRHASRMLSKRFPSCPRQYIHHMPKTLTRPILEEASIMFAADLDLAATRPFRESTNGQGDIEMAFLITHLRIERWREALLWSWAVAKQGDTWNDATRQELRHILSSELDQDVAIVPKIQRDTLRHKHQTFSQSGWRAPLATDYLFTSLDGHLPRLTVLRDPENNNENCTFHMQRCLGDFAKGADVSAADMFKRLTFQDSQCGDCLISALITASGSKGLSAFLPAPDSTSTLASVAPQPDHTPPHLPLTATWEEADFSLSAVIPYKANLRLWTLKLLARYVYTLGGTPSKFDPLHSISEARGAMKFLDAHPEVAMVCINDNVPDRMADQVARAVNDWMAARWSGIAAWWERPRSLTW